jgi:hypothetical protein
MNAVSKMMVGCILAILVILVMVISSGSYSMIQVNAQQQQAIQEAQISNIPEIYECQMLHPSWNTSATNEDFKLFEEKDCWNQIARDPVTGEPLDPSTTPP